MQQFGASKSGDLTSELTYYMQRWTRKHCCYVSLATDDDYGTIRFEDEFCTSRNGGMKGGGWVGVKQRVTVHGRP